MNVLFYLQTLTKANVLVDSKGFIYVKVIFVYNEYCEYSFKKIGGKT